jgi:hypothetical protein
MPQGLISYSREKGSADDHSWQRRHTIRRSPGRPSADEVAQSSSSAIDILRNLELLCVVQEHDLILRAATTNLIDGLAMK